MEEVIQLIPGYDPASDCGDSHFEWRAASHAIGFFELFLTHVKGSLAGQPFQLADWQKAIVANLFGWKLPDGRRRYREAFIYLPRKNGKMLDLTTPLPTPNGWTTMGDVCVGDCLFDENGLQCRVTEITSVDPAPDSYLITFSNGETVMACADHQWVTKARVDRPGYKKRCGAKRLLTRVRTTRELYETQYFGKRHDRNHSIDMPAELHLPDARLLIDPYVFGCWLGDGTSACPQLTCHTNDVAHFTEEFNRAGYETTVYLRVGRASQLTIRTLEAGFFGPVPVSKTAGANLAKRLRHLGVLNNKHIPSIYLRASFSQRLALLQGLMDTDGTAGKSGALLEFVTTRPLLRDGFGELLATLGIKYSCRDKPAMLKGREVSRAYRFQFFISPDNMPVFRMERKLTRISTAASRQSSQRSRSVQIVSVEPCASVPMRCIAVDSASHLYRFGRTMLPTHNTTLAAGIPLYVLFCDPERGKEIYAAAADREQAGILFGIAQQMVLHEPALYSRCDVLKKAITRDGEGSFFRAISKDANTKHGYNASVVVVDELHAQPDRELVDVLETSTGSRDQPLFILITTADFERPSICNEKHDYARNVRDGVIKDRAFLPVVYEPGPDDDWRDTETWKKVNPNLGVSLNMEYMERKFEKALREPMFENTFKRLHLNQKTQTDVKWLGLDDWDKCGTSDFDRAMLYGANCYAGLDLASTEDVAACVLYFPATAQTLPFFFAPEATAEKRERKGQGQYLTWSRQGHMELTDGGEIDHDVIEARICELAEEFNILEIAYDRWNSHGIVKHLKAKGFKMTPVGQGFASLTSPMKDLERLVMSEKLNHGGNPVLRWMAGNVALEEDSAGNYKPSRKRSADKIDGIVALVMAIASANLADEEGNVYDGRGFLQL